MEKLQDALHGEGSREVVCARDNFRKLFEFSINLVHEFTKS
jgi:hypothetical protein